MATQLQAQQSTMSLMTNFIKTIQKTNGMLSTIGLVAQLAGKVNSQVVEQFFSKLKKNNYFLNMTLP